MGVTLNRTIRNNFGVLERRMAAGASVRVALIEPDSLTSKEASRRDGRSGEDAGVFENRLRPTIDALRHLASLPYAEGRLEVRFLDFVPAFGLTIVDRGTDEPTLTVDIYSHGPTAPEVAITLRSAWSPELYHHFCDEFERIWSRGRSVRAEDGFVSTAGCDTPVTAVGVVDPPRPPRAASRTADPALPPPDTAPTDQAGARTAPANRPGARLAGPSRAEARLALLRQDQ